jgi:hypothetical protein
VDGFLHDAEAEHACERHPLAEGNSYFGEVLRRPEEDDEVTQRVLTGVKVVNGFDVKALRRSNVLEDLPVRTRGSAGMVSGSSDCAVRVYLRALEQCYEEAGYVQ